MQRQGDIHYAIDWTTLGEYLQQARSGAALRPNVASYVGAGTVRTNVLGERDVQPTAAAADADARPGPPGDGGGRARRHDGAHLQPQRLRQDTGADRARQRVGALRGIYSAHMRSEGDRLLEAVQETVDDRHGLGWRPPRSIT